MKKLAPLVLAGTALFPLAAHAIDVTPEDAIAPKPGISAVQFGYTASRRGDYYLRDIKQSSITQVDTSQTHVRFSQSFEWSGRPSVFYVQAPYLGIQTKNVGASDAPAGMGDLTLLLATWLHTDRERGHYLGVGGYLFLPTGEYDAEKTKGINTNPGENRYKVALQAAHHLQFTHHLGWMVAADTVWFGDNNRYYGGDPTAGRLSRRPLYTLQNALNAKLNDQFSLGANYIYAMGGETTLAGVEKNDDVRVQRYELTANYRFSANKITLQYGGDIKTKTGFKEDGHVILRFTRFF